MDPTVQPSYTYGQISAALFIGCSALLIIGLQPLLFGALVDNGALSMEGVGIVAMGEIATLGIGVAVSNVFLPIAYHRPIVVMAALICVILNLATARALSESEFIAVRSMAGLAEGVLVWAASNVIVRAAKADWLAAIFMLLQALTQAAMAGVLSVLVMPRGGWAAGFEGLAIVSALSAIVAFVLPQRLVSMKGPEFERLRWSAATLVPPAVAFLHMSAIGGLWAYMEEIALDVGLGVSSAQHLISGVLLMQFVGGIASVWLIRRVDAVFMLHVSSAVLVAVMACIILLPASAPLSLTLVSAVFGIIWLILMPFHLGLALRVDDRGRVALYIPAAQLLGSAFGPLVASAVVTGQAAGKVPLVGLAFALAGALLMFALGRRSNASLSAVSRL